MQQYYPNNLEKDPTRMGFTSQDLLPKKNIFNMMKNKNNNLTFNSSERKQQPSMFRENMFSQDYNRNDGLTQEMMEKDKKIQELQFQMKQVEFEKDSMKGKLDVIKQYEEEIKILSYKLREEYEKNKELVMLKNQIKLLEKDKKNDQKIINDLQKKLNIDTPEEEGITLNIFDEEKDTEEEEIKEIDYDEIYKKTLQEQESNEKYKNEKLKTIISKYLPKIDDSKIDNIFIEMKIEPTTEINKELIKTIVRSLNE